MVMKRRAVLLGLLASGLAGGCANEAGVAQSGQGAPVKEIKTAAALKGELAIGGVLLIHAFDAENYAQGHIQGAVNVDYEKMTPAMLPADKEKPLVFYCIGGHCPVGRLAAQKAAGWGYRNSRVYSGGMDDWRAMGNKLVTGDK